MGVPSLRVTSVDPDAQRSVSVDGDYVLYWMIIHRRLRHNFALERAVEWANRLGKPLLILETLKLDYPHASVRFSSFMVDAMREHVAEVAGLAGVHYYGFVEREVGQSDALLAQLAKRACVVVTDEYPAFILPAMVAEAARMVPVHFEKVDACGVLPLRATSGPFVSAYLFRRHLQKVLPEHLMARSLREPLRALALQHPELDCSAYEERWPNLARDPMALNVLDLPLSRSVGVVEQTRGGASVAQGLLKRFVAERLAAYADERHDATREFTSGLAPYLHFGQIASEEVLWDILTVQNWHPGLLAAKVSGAKSGWWGIGAGAEAFLDQLVTWRELGFVTAFHWPDRYDRYESLPEWALETLERHAHDPRLYCYSLTQFEQAQTHDPIWNAAQRQLCKEGRIHNYLRMLWGKKILEWSPTPAQALETMLLLNDRYALDGRDPNSVSGIFWCLGRYDRPWGPERPIFGKIRYMSSDNTARKMDLSGYLLRHRSF
jgi:deoxyribodipyrimidine photo-lyase